VAQECTGGHSISSSSAKKALRRSLELKQEQKVLQAASEESALKKNIEDDERLQDWNQVVTNRNSFRSDILANHGMFSREYITPTKCG